MQFSQVYPKLKARWISNWKSRKLSQRIVELALQLFGYLCVTLLLMMTASASILYLLPVKIQQGSIQFLALIYICCLGIITARSFDQNHFKFQLDLIAADIERIALNTGSLEIETLVQSVNNLNDRIGPP